MSRGKPLSFDRNEVLLKALELFWEKGFANTGMTELLAHMGIQRQSFYNTFGNKEEVFIEALKLYNSNNISKVSNIMAKDRHPLENIQEVFVLFAESSERKKGCGCLLVNSMTEFGDSQDAVGELLKEMVHGAYNVYLKAFTSAITKGYLPETKNPKVLATAFISMLHGATTLRKVGFDEKILDEIFEATEEMFSG